MQQFFVSLLAWVPGFLGHEIDQAALLKSIALAEIHVPAGDTRFTVAAKAIIADAAAIFPGDELLRMGAVRLLTLLLESHAVPSAPESPPLLNL